MRANTVSVAVSSTSTAPTANPQSASQPCVKYARSPPGLNATPNAGPPTGPTKSVVDPTGKYLYVSDVVSKQIRPFAIGANGALSPLQNSVITLSKPPYAMHIMSLPTGNYMYIAAADGFGAEIFFYQVAPDGSLVSQFPGAYGSTPQPMELVSDPQNKFLFCMDHNAGIRSFRVNPNGTLVLTGPEFAEGGYQLFAAAVSPDGKYLYASAGQGGAIREDTINPDGTLSHLGKLSGYFANGMAVDSPRSRLYLATDTGVTGFQIQQDGALTKIGADQLFSSLATAAAITPDGKSLYLVAQNNPNNLVAQYSLDAAGALSPLSQATVPSGQPRIFDASS